MAKKTAKKSKAPAKASAKKRTLNAKTAKPKKGPGQPHAPFAEQDPKRRLGNFEGKGEAPLRLQRGGARKG